MAAQPLPKVLLNSVPKSGTNLLLQMLQGIPGLKMSEIEPLGIYIQLFFTGTTPTGRDRFRAPVLYSSICRTAACMEY